MTSRTARQVAKPALALLALMMSVGPFGDTEYTPAMPAIAHALHVDYGMVQFTMASYLAGSSLGQLYWGPASDRFGRRPVMLAGATVLLAGSLLCLLSFFIWPLVGGRLVQGIGACAGGVVADAAVRDAFAADKRQRIYARLNAAFSLAPAIGPVAGTYVQSAMGWHGNFGVLAALAVLLLVLVWRYLPETRPRHDTRALQPRRMMRNYRRTLWTPEFLVFSVLGGCCIGVVYTSLIGAPDLVINMLGRGSGAIVVVAGSILVAFVFGAGACAWASNRISDHWVILLGMAIVLGGSAALLVIGLVLKEQGQLVDYLLPIAACFIGVGLVVPLTTTRAMAPFGHTAGTAASLLGGVRMGIAAVGTAMMSVLHKGSVIDMPIVFLVLSVAGAAVFLCALASRAIRPSR